MYKLLSEVGRWALKDGSMLFGQVVWLCSEEDKRLYHLVDNNLNEIEFDVDKCLVKEKLD